jgi:hypothetical protein
MVTCVGKTSEPQVVAFLPHPNPATAVVGVDLVAEAGLQNLFPSLTTTTTNNNNTSARPTILEPIESHTPPQQQQQQHSPMQTQQPNNIGKSSVVENNLKNIRSSSFCDDEPGFDFPIMRHRASSDHRSYELSQKLSEYRIHESIVDDNSMPSGAQSAGFQDEDSLSSPSSGFQQRLNFAGMINPTGFGQCVDTPMAGGYSGSETPVYSLPISGQNFAQSEFIFQRF